MRILKRTLYNKHIVSSLHSLRKAVLSLGRLSRCPSGTLFILQQTSLMLLTSPVYICAVLLLLVVFSEWLSRKKYFHYLGSSLIVILAAAVLANLKLIPSSRNAPPLYEGIFNYIAPLAIFYLLLDVRLKDIRLAGLPMLTMFFIGSAATVAGTLAGFYLVLPAQHSISKAFAVAGMYTGTYIGGSANLNAIALQYDVIKDGTLFAAVNAADNIVTTTWIILTLVLPPLFQKFFPRKSFTGSYNKSKDEHVLPVDTAREQVTVTGLSLLAALGVGSLCVSQLISNYIPQVPAILVLTTLALILAQVKPLQQVKGGKIVGFIFVLLFLAVVGAYCDVEALFKSKEVALVLMKWVTVIVFVHGALIFSIGGLLKQDWNIVSIASNANIGGATSAAVLATSLNRPDLRLPGILVGSIGNAIGTYAGVLVAEYLK